MPTLLLFLSLLAPQESTGRPDPAALVEQARALLPKYEGDHRESLTPEQRRDVRAADHLFQAALELQGESAYALWWDGHARTLLAENASNRGWSEEAAFFGAGALDSFERAIALDPGYAWAFYARGTAHRALGSDFAAVEDFREAVRLANATIADAAEGAAQDALFVRFKARQWGADSAMRVFAFDEAREEFRTFYAENGNNQWDLGYSLAETYQRERDFAEARRVYEGLLENEAFRGFDSTYTQLAYLAGLTGDVEEALRRLDEAFQRERQPSLYPRLWAWLLARGEAWSERRAAALADLREFLEAPPSDLAPWDATLGAFMVGELDEAAFTAAAEDELRSRFTEARAIDALPCEVSFYRGARLEHEAAGRSPEERVALLRRALEAYATALAYAPTNFKWEWAYARERYAAVARELGFAEARRFTVRGEAVDLGSAFEPLRVHRAGTPRSEPVAELAAAGWRPGDLILGHRLLPDGTRRAVRVVCAAD